MRKLFPDITHTIWKEEDLDTNLNIEVRGQEGNHDILHQGDMIDMRKINLRIIQQ